MGSVDMDVDNDLNPDIASVSESNLGTGVLFSDYSSGNLILTSDMSGGLSSFEGTLCFDETNNELVYVNMPVQMISSSISNTDSIPNVNSTFSSYSASSISPLTDLPLFSDGGQVMLFTGGSIIIPNDEENLIPSNSDPFVLECVLNGSQPEQKLGDCKTPITIDFEDALESNVKQKKKCCAVENAETVNNHVGDAEKKGTIGCTKNAKHSCKLCFEKFGSLKDYKKHLTNHNDHKIHECKLCGVSFNKINNLVLHQITHSNDTKCPLPGCQKKFNRKASLKAHVKLHEEDDSLTCSECGEEFRNQLYLELHYKYQSQCRFSSFEPTTSPSRSKTLLCKLCDRNFERIETFIAHKKEHEKLKKALATKSHKKKSTSTVPSSRINRCKMCPKWFLKPSQLIRHMRIHTGERPFVCNVCDKAFNQANSLKIHMLKHTGDRPFQCPFCGTSFSQRGNLRQHINRVHSIPKVEEKVYKCSECPCMFKKMCSLNAHKNRVHQRLYNGNRSSVTTKYASKADQGESTAADLTKEGTAITIENGVDDVDDEDMAVLLDKDSDINTISINFDNGNGTICNQNVLVKKQGNTRIYRCSHCPKENVKLKEIIRHLKFSILGKPFKCEHCAKTFSQRPTFLTHLTLHATADMYRCAVCDRSFSNPLEVKIHSKLHGDTIERRNSTDSGTSFRNNLPNSGVCSADIDPTSSIADSAGRINSNVAIASADVAATKKSYRSPEGYRWNAHNAGAVNLVLPPYDCKFCQVGFESYYKLKQHLRGIHDAVICQNCSPRFLNKTTVARYAGNQSAEETRKRTRLKCGKRLRTEKRRDLHYKCHPEESGDEVECQLCGKIVVGVDGSPHKRAKNTRDSHSGRGRQRRRRRRHRHHCFSSSSSSSSSSGVALRRDAPSTINERNADARSSRPVDNDSADDVGEIGTPTIAQLTDVNSDATNPFADDAASVAVFVSCDVAATATDQAQAVEISVTNDDGFSATNTAARAFDAALQTSANRTQRTDHQFSGGANESSLIDESQITVNENVENSIELRNDHLKTQLLTLHSLEDNLFEFQSNVIPIQVNHEDVAASSEGLTNNADAVIYKSTKCFAQSFAEMDAHDGQNGDDGDGDDVVVVNLNGGEANSIDSYFYACNTCYLTFRNLPTLLKHLQTHDGSTLFECLYCGKENKTQAQLTHHIAQHSLRKEFPCVHCGELFDSLNVVKKHITDIHLMSSVDKKSEQKRKKNSANDLLLSEKQKMQIACQKPHKYSSISEKVLSSLLKNNAVAAAENTKTRVRPWLDRDEKPNVLAKKKKYETRKMQKENICSYCSRAFKKMCDLVRHIRIHTGEKPFKCDYCSKCFTVKSILNCHLKTHFSVNNIFCHVCNRFFATVGSLKTHMRLHTGERPYKCLYCKETFRTSGHRDSHQKRHLGGRDKAAKWKCSAESALIEIEDNELGVHLEPAEDADAVYILPGIGDPNDFKFQDVDLSDMSGGNGSSNGNGKGDCNGSVSGSDDDPSACTSVSSSARANKRSHCCAICRKAFEKKCDLDRHLSGHANEKTFRCEICDSRFNQESSLKIHLRQHTRTTDEQWPCDECGSVFVSAKTLKTHKVRHHPETLNTPIRDVCFDGRVEIIEMDKDVNKWCINNAAAAEIFAEKMVDVKKYDGTSDFYSIDKHFDLNSMMQDLFPDDEKQ